MHIDKFLMINCDDNLYLQKKKKEGREVTEGDLVYNILLQVYFLT